MSAQCINSHFEKVSTVTKYFKVLWVLKKTKVYLNGSLKILASVKTKYTTCVNLVRVVASTYIDFRTFPVIKNIRVKLKVTHCVIIRAKSNKYENLAKATAFCWGLINIKLTKL